MTIDVAIYDALRKYLGDGTIDLDSDTLNVALLTSAYNPAPGVADWVAATSYADGTIIKVASAGNRFYEAIGSGVSSGTLPIFPTMRGSLLTENSVTWKCWGFSPPSTHSVFADVSANEIAGTGYTAGGATMTGAAMNYSGRHASFTASPTQWAGALFTAHYAVLYKVGTANGKVNPLIAYLLLDNTGVDVVLTASTTFSLNWDVAGIFTLN